MPSRTCALSFIVDIHARSIFFSIEGWGFAAKPLTHDLFGWSRLRIFLTSNVWTK